MTEQAPDRKTFNKKILIPIAIAAIALIATLAIIMVAKYGNTGADNDRTNSEIAEDLSPYLPNYTKGEIEEILGTDLTDEQKDYTSQMIGSISMPDPDDIDIAEDGTMTYQDGNGNIVVKEPNEELLNMTEDELKAKSDKIDQYLQAIIDGDYSGVDDSMASYDEPDPEEGNTVDNSQTMEELAQSIAESRGETSAEQ